MKGRRQICRLPIRILLFSPETPRSRVIHPGLEPLDIGADCLDAKGINDLYVRQRLVEEILDLTVCCDTLLCVGCTSGVCECLVNIGIGEPVRYAAAGLERQPPVLRRKDRGRANTGAAYMPGVLFSPLFVKCSPIHDVDSDVHPEILF